MKRLILISAIVICAGCGHGDKNILLQLQYKPGDQVDIKYHAYVIKDGDLGSPLSNEIVRMGFKVDSVVGDSLYLMSAKVNYLRTETEWTQSFDRGNISYDEDEASSNPPGLKAVLDSKYKLVIDRRGQIVKPFALPNQIGESILEPLNFSNCQVMFPTGKIAIGDDWDSGVVGQAREGTRQSTYHIESIFDGKIQIKEEGTFVSPRDGAHKFSGRYILDEKTKRLISSKIELDQTFLGRGLKLVIDIEAKNWGYM